MLREAILSAILHFLVIILLIIGLPHLFQRPVEPTPIIPVEIVNIADVTQAPLPKAKPDPTPPPPMPQNEPEPEPEAKVEEKKPEPVKPKLAEPKPAEPKPEPLPSKEVKESLDDLLESVSKEQKKEAPKEKKKSKKDFMSVLKNVEKIEKTAIQEGNADISPHNIQNISDLMTVTEMDLIRQQLKERWIQQGADRDIKGLRVDIYVEINPDATVRTARIEGSNLSLSNPIHQAFANSALRSVTKPEPLKIPLDRRGELKTFIVTFTPENMY